jgi:hypothetical protein
MDRDHICGVLLRCIIFSFVLMLIYLGFMLLGRGFVYGVHSSMFDVTKHEFEVIHYCGLALLKLFVLVAFVIPYLAIRLGPKK